jgi:zinc transport system ATP-binding protein
MPADGEAPAISMREVSVTYGGPIAILNDVNLQIPRGQFVAVAGPNGGGKTTLLKAILGLVPLESGSVTLHGPLPGQPMDRRRIGYLRQRASVGVEAPVTVEEVVAAGRLPAAPRFGPLRAVDRAAVRGALDDVGLLDRLKHPMRSLSGGQQQRVFLAKLLAGEPQLVILDEPTTGVDAGSQEAFGELLCDLNSRLGVTILYVSHEFAAVEEHVDRLILVNGGITFDGSPEDLPQVWHDPSHSHPHPHVSSQVNS